MPKAKKKELTPAEKRAIDVKEEIMDKLDSLYEMGVSALTNNDKAFIRARASYLTGDMKEEFAPLFVQPKEEVKDDLKERAKALGIKYVGVKKEDLEKAVADAEALEK